MADHTHVVADLFQRRKLTLIAGPCVVESLDMCLRIADSIQAMATKFGIPFIFKASFDKANRTSFDAYRGPGLTQGLEILAQVREKAGVPIITDIHEPQQAILAANVVDVLQIPAFLCRQTELITAAAKTGKPTNVKKGQFMAPHNMSFVVEKFRMAGGGDIAVTERGTSFGYHDLVVDMRSLDTLRRIGDVSVIFDATHSVQRSDGGVTRGDRTQVPLLCRAAAAVGIDGLFCEVHPTPDLALSDAANCIDFNTLESIIKTVMDIDPLVRAS